MRKLIAILVIGATLWGGYWFVGAAAVERGMAGWLATRRADGWAADYARLETRGFPNRFDTTITDLKLADPTGGFAWSMPFFQLLALSYRPHHVIAVWPDRQTFATPLQQVGIATERMRGSLVVRPGTSLALDRSGIVADGATLTSDLGWQAAFDEGRFAVERQDVAEARYRLGAEIVGLTPGDALRRALGPGADLPAGPIGLRLDASVDFSRPWDLSALEGTRPQPRRLTLDSLHAEWGPVELRARGTLEVDTAGRASGRIDVEADDWRELLAIGIAGGIVPQGAVPNIERGIELLAGLSGTPDRVTAPLTFRDGFVSFGPVPLGPAPRFVLR